MHVRFWGTRGSIARPGPTTLRYGGNTSCVEVRGTDGTLVVLDCGTGAHELGNAILRDPPEPRRGHLLIGHTHWDHLQGFPFFAPFFDPSFEWDVYAPGGRSRQIEDSLSALMSYDFHPVTLDSLEARVRLHDLKEGAFQVGGIHVRTQYLHHPVLTLGYRLEAPDAVFVYASDHEPHSLHARGEGIGELPLHHEDERHVAFLRDADLVVHDAQYTLDQFPQKVGWGHTPVERAVDYAIAAGARRLALYHHDPDHDDETVDRIVACAAQRAAAAGSPLQVFGAREGEALDLARGAQAGRTSEPLPSALITGPPARAATVLIVEDDPDMVAFLQAALKPEGVRLLSASRVEEALGLARAEVPTLALLDLGLGGGDGLDVCRALRDDRDSRLRAMPIVILTGERLSDADVEQAFRAGATDYLTKPIKPTLVRARVRGWLMRERARKPGLPA